MPRDELENITQDQDNIDNENENNLAPTELSKDQAKDMERLKERLSFIEMDENLLIALNKNNRKISKAIPNALDHFYSVIEHWPEVNDMFPSSDIKKHAQSQQEKHWQRIARGVFDHNYLQSTLTIGLTHNRIGLEPRWYIGGYAQITAHLARNLITSSFKKPFVSKKEKEDLAELFEALIKAVCLDMDLAISTYLTQRDEDYAKLLEEMTDHFDHNMSGYLRDLREASQKLMSTSDNLASISTEGLKQSEVLNMESNTAYENVNVVAAAAEELAASIKHITEQITYSDQVSIEAVEKSKSARQAIADMQETADKIGNVVNIINDIAEQTNLLALNATIEAARAGDAGKGFAVVASEVKELANQTANATAEIATQIEQVKQNVASTVKSISEVSSTIENIRETSSSISAAMEEQATATEEIVRSAQGAAQSAQNVTETSNQVSGTSRETEGEARQIGEASLRMSNETKSLREKLEYFLANIKTQGVTRQVKD